MVCSGLGQQPLLAWAAAEYLCAVKLGLIDKPLAVVRRRALHTLVRTPLGVNQLVAVAAATSVLRHPVVVKRKRLGGVPFGPLRQRLSVFYPGATWDMQVCPEAFWHRVVVSGR